jgi:molecular chaperone GrpE
MADNKDDFEDSDITSKGNGKDEEEDIEIELLDPDQPGRSSLEQVSSVNPTLEIDREIETLRKEKEDLYDRLLRKQADFENFRKRMEREKREFQQYALSDIMGELIFILDNFERAFSHSGEASSEYKKGVELIYRQLKDVLEKRGLKAIETTGRKFDPNFHEAVAREERNDLEEGTILEELQRGYFFQTRLLRPAMVKVSYSTHEDAPEGGSSEKTSEDEWVNSES